MILLRMRDGERVFNALQLYEGAHGPFEGRKVVISVEEHNEWMALKQAK